MPANEPRRIKLSEDGELPDLDTLINTPDEETELIYCTQCGTANAANSRYCRNCGTALALQKMTGAPRVGDEFKRKNEALAARLQTSPAPESTSNLTLWSMIIRVFNMLAIGGIAMSALIHGAANAWVAIPALIAWILVEIARGQKTRNANLWDMISSVATTAVITGISLAAIIGGAANAWVAIPALIAWVLVEVARG